VSDPAGETRKPGAGAPDGAVHAGAAEAASTVAAVGASGASASGAGATVADAGASGTAPAAAAGGVAGLDGSALRWLWLSLGVLVLDQLTKALIVAKFELYERIDVLPILEMTRLHNYGAAFSLLHDAGGWQHYFFVSLALLVSVGITVWLSRLRFRANAMLGSGLALILGGALGNVIDRLMHGHVVDFIHFHWYERWYFPAFNVADTAITIGAGLLILDSLLESRRAATPGAT
jgi:signal peptidase II